MTHPHDDVLLLHAYGDTTESQAAQLQEHLVACAECRARFRVLVESRAAVDWGLERRTTGRYRRMAWAVLPLAAAIGGVILWRGVAPAPPERESWQTHLTASPTAGYVTGGSTFISIDSQLVRLEQRRSYGSLD